MVMILHTSHNKENMLSAPMSISEWLDKENGLLFSHKERPSHSLADKWMELQTMRKQKEPHSNTAHLLSLQNLENKNMNLGWDDTWGREERLTHDSRGDHDQCTVYSMRAETVPRKSMFVHLVYKWIALKFLFEKKVEIKHFYLEGNKWK